jgi:hypothetical protein
MIDQSKVATTVQHSGRLSGTSHNCLYLSRSRMLLHAQPAFVTSSVKWVVVSPFSRFRLRFCRLSRHAIPRFCNALFGFTSTKRARRTYAYLASLASDAACVRISWCVCVCVCMCAVTIGSSHTRHRGNTGSACTVIMSVT